MAWSTSNCTSHVRLLRGQKEITPSTLKPHYQVYFELDKSVRMAGAKKELGCNEAHMEIARGTLEHNLKYCSKLETRDPAGINFSIGDLKDSKAKIGSTEAAEMIMKRKLPDLLKQDPGWCLHNAGKIHKFRDIMNECVSYPDFRPVTCIFIQGPSGIGKTGAVYAMYGHNQIITMNKGGTQWWLDERYDPEVHHVLLIDELGEDEMPLTLANNICDNYPTLLPVKGGHKTMNWNIVIFTSNNKFNACFPKDYQFGALRRRFSIILEINDSHDWDLAWLEWLHRNTAMAGWNHLLTDESCLRIHHVAIPLCVANKYENFYQKYMAEHQQDWTPTGPIMKLQIERKNWAKKYADSMLPGGQDNSLTPTLADPSNEDG